ncbi:hypothetical protein [Cognatishimia sp. MH4019]|uniref:hypothetical protein n=1 Tax=Cognatishimia sp. MH4019 TaxID=2854030 RepID=UPI001CD75BEC|nr:hypothetical protein [Cognatishimia sp. MH4019]
MNSYFIPAALTAFLVTATALSAGPADDFGKAIAASTPSAPQTLQIAAEKLSGDGVDEQITISRDVISTQNVGISQGHARLAAEMGVDPADYTNAELAKMFIGEYD